MGYSPSASIPLSAFGAPATDIAMNSHKFTGLLDGAGALDSAGWDQLSYVANQVAYVASGCVWTADAAGSTLAASMTAGTVVVGGLVYSVTAVTSRAFTASKDTYVDINIQSGVATLTYTEVSNNQTSPALVSSGTALNTVRNAIVVSAASSIANVADINQGQVAGGPNITAISTTTVAIGSNGAGFAATPLNVASTTGYPTAGFLTIAHAQTPYFIQYTGISGNTFTGVSAYGVGGVALGTVSTSDVVTSVIPFMVTDTIGNLIYPASPYPRLIGYNGYLGASFSTTSTTANVPVVVTGNSQPGGGPTFSFVVPPGPSRMVKLVGHLCYAQSSAAAGTTIAVNLGVDGTTVSTAQFKVAVASDGMALHPEGITRLAPGSHVFTMEVSQGAAGTLALGITYLVTAAYVQLL